MTRFQLTQRLAGAALVAALAGIAAQLDALEVVAVDELQRQQVGQGAVKQQKKGRAQQKAENHGYKTKAAHVAGHFHGWLQKAEKSRAKHHAACRAKKTVHGLTRKFAAGENEGGPQGY